MLLFESIGHGYDEGANLQSATRRRSLSALPWVRRALLLPLLLALMLPRMLLVAPANRLTAMAGGRRAFLFWFCPACNDSLCRFRYA